MQEDFQKEISDLAGRAAIESVDLQSSGKKPPSDQSPSIWWWIAGFAIAIEIVLLIVLRALNQAPRDITTEGVPARYERADDCSAVAYRTYRAVVAWKREHGAPPPSLVALVPSRLPGVPVDPESGMALVYQTDGTAFHLECPVMR